MEHCDALDFDQLIAAVSPEDEQRVEPFGRWEFVEMPNIPLSAKFQAAVRPGADAYMMLGSDDFPDAAFVAKAREVIEDYQLLQPLDIFMADSERAFYCDGWETGAGRTVRVDLLERIGWNLWPERADRGLDKKMWQRLASRMESCYLYKHSQEETVVVDYKTGENMWSLEETLPLLPLYIEVEPDLILPECLVNW